MNTRPRKAIKIFRRKTRAAFFTYGGQVTLAMSKAVTTFPNPVPALGDIDTELENFSELLKSAATGNKVEITLKENSRAILTNMMSALTDYVNFIAKGSETTLAESSMDMSEFYELIKITAPVGLVLKDGPTSGTLKFKCKRARGVKSYFFQYSSDPQMKDATTVSIASSTASYIFTGLTKSKTYYCRVAAVSGHKQLFYSNIVERVCN
jgi:hypothetical protein